MPEVARGGGVNQHRADHVGQIPVFDVPRGLSVGGLPPQRTRVVSRVMRGGA
jgi:hypothetical protein